MERYRIQKPTALSVFHWLAKEKTSAENTGAAPKLACPTSAIGKGRVTQESRFIRSIDLPQLEVLRYSTDNRKTMVFGSTEWWVEDELYTDRQIYKRVFCSPSGDEIWKKKVATMTSHDDRSDSTPGIQVFPVWNTKEWYCNPS